MNYRLPALTSNVLKSIFDAAFMEAHLDGDGDCMVTDDVKLFVIPEPSKGVLTFWAMFGAKGTRTQVLEFCNRFNWNMVACRAYVRGDEPDGDGDWTVIFDYPRFVAEDEELQPKWIVTQVRRFAKIVRGGIGDWDSDDLF